MDKSSKKHMHTPRYSSITTPFFLKLIKKAIYKIVDTHNSELKP